MSWYLPIYALSYHSIYKCMLTSITFYYIIFRIIYVNENWNMRFLDYNDFCCSSVFELCTEIQWMSIDFVSWSFFQDDYVASWKDNDTSNQSLPNTSFHVCSKSNGILIALIACTWSGHKYNMQMNVVSSFWIVIFTMELNLDVRLIPFSF